MCIIEAERKENMAKLENGDRWGGIEVVEVAWKRITETDRGVTDSYNAEMARLKCVCGKVWEVKAREIPLAKKKRDRDCGCGTPIAGGMGKIGRANVCWYISMEATMAATRLANERNISVSRAAEELILMAARGLNA